MAMRLNPLITKLEREELISLIENFCSASILIDFQKKVFQQNGIFAEESPPTARAHRESPPPEANAARNDTRIMF